MVHSGHPEQPHSFPRMWRQPGLVGSGSCLGRLPLVWLGGSLVGTGVPCLLYGFGPYPRWVPGCLTFLAVPVELDSQPELDFQPNPDSQPEPS